MTSGEQTAVDVNGDGRDDIGIKVLAIKAPTVTLSVWKIAEPAIAAPPLANTGTSNSVASAASSSKSHTLIYSVAAASVLLIAGAALWYKRKLRRMPPFTPPAV